MKTFELMKAAVEESPQHKCDEVTSSLSATSKCWNREIVDEWTPCILCHLPWSCLSDPHVSLTLKLSQIFVQQNATKVKSVSLWNFGRHEPLLWLALKCFPKRQNARGIETQPTWVDDSMTRVMSSPKRVMHLPSPTQGKDMKDWHIVPVFWSKLYGSIGSASWRGWFRACAHVASSSACALWHQKLCAGGLGPRRLQLFASKLHCLERKVQLKA